MNSRLIVQGGHPLEGTIRNHGAKNSVLPILAATILNGGENILHNCPDLRDVSSAIEILRHLGCRVERSGSDIFVDSAPMDRWDIPDHLMREMRSSVMFLGPILARCGRAHLTFPGGCDIGQRPIDLHLSALSQMGVEIREEGGAIDCRCKAPRGGEISLSFPSVGATENIMLFACACPGETRIINAAREPEIADLEGFLNCGGAHISGAGEYDILIRKGEKRAVEYTVMADRMEAATYLCACAAAGGDLEITDTNPGHYTAVAHLLQKAGCRIESEESRIRIWAPKRLKSIELIRTMPYPGFPTDAQSPLMAALCLAEGTSLFSENIFENRYRHCGELCRMGANIRVEGRVAAVKGVEKLHGTAVRATDLRGGAAMVIAALAAEGCTEITEIEHIDRGYEEIEKVFARVGGNIIRENI